MVQYTQINTAMKNSDSGLCTSNDKKLTVNSNKQYKFIHEAQIIN
jgi:hypothetical protein